MGDAIAGVGVIGCGNISDRYLSTLNRVRGVSLVAVADLDADRAHAAASAWPGVRALSVDDLLASSGVDIVLNLTNPAAHAEVSTGALRAGKHVYTEKPFASDVRSGRELITLAGELGVQIGSAPDTVLGVGTQTARAVLDRGDIGEPIAATAFMAIHGHESWHPRAQFYFQPGGGPLFDMGPYYLSALVHLLGPVARVIGLARRGEQERILGSGPDAGTRFPVEVETHVTGILEHRSGALSTVIMSFEVWRSHLPLLEVHGTEGSLSCPDPNRFDGPVELYRRASQSWEPVAVAAGYSDAGRGVGVADLAGAVASGEQAIASGELGQHVLEVMEALLKAAQTGTRVDIPGTCRRPPQVPLIPAVDAATWRRGQQRQ